MILDEPAREGGGVEASVPRLIEEGMVGRGVPELALARDQVARPHPASHTDWKKASSSSMARR